MILSTKESAAEVEELPILFIISLVTYKTTGMENPSPRAPRNPKAINHKSAASACMNMDRTEPLLFFLPPISLPTHNKQQWRFSTNHHPLGCSIFSTFYRLLASKKRFCPFQILVREEVNGSDGYI